MHGGCKNRGINGMVTFGRCERGVLITAEIYGLSCEDENSVYPFCIHNGSCMSLDENGDFCKGEGYFNPEEKPAPLRAGDLPPLFACNGYAYMQVVSNRFSIEDIIGKSVIIHSPTKDVFPSDNSKSTRKISCGIILSTG